MAKVKAMAKALAAQSNESYWDEVIKNSPKFKQFTSALTQQRLTTESVEALANAPTDVKTDFYGTLLRVVWQKLDVARATNGFEQTGFMEEWATPYGEYTQRMAVGMVTPISPKYRGLENGDSVDPWVVRKPEISERFFSMNYDYQNLITIQNPDFKRILLTDGQIGAVIAGIFEGMETGRIVQENLLTKETLHRGLSSTLHPLLDTQQYKVDTITSNDISAWTDQNLVDLLVAIGDIFSGMFAVDMPATGMFNAGGFKTRVESDEYVMFMRSGIKNRLNKITRAGTYNPEYLNLDIDGRVWDINNFGGLVPYAEAEYTTELYPIFDIFGSETGYYIDATNASTAVTAGTLVAKTATPSGGDTQTIGYQIATARTTASSITGAVAEASVYFKDPHADIIAVIAQKGIMGINRQNGYTVDPSPYNPGGLYTDYWGNQPNNGIYYDYYYNMIVIRSNATA